eukprot:3775877-Prymnesium_polylepis.1
MAVRMRGRCSRSLTPRIGQSPRPSSGSSGRSVCRSTSATWSSCSVSGGKSRAAAARQDGGSAAAACGRGLFAIVVACKRVPRSSLKARAACWLAYGR